MTQPTAQQHSNRSPWPCTATQSLGIALLRLETARELARVRLRRADRATLVRWAEHELRVELLLDEWEQRLAAHGEAAVQAAAASIRTLELEVCEFIQARPS